MTDSVANDGQCSLREAMLNAESDNQNGSIDCQAGAGADMIYLPAGTLTLSWLSPLGLPSSLPAVTGDITLYADDPAATLISGNHQVRPLDVSNGGKLTLRNLTVRDGKSAEGGALHIFSGGEARLDHAKIFDSEATSAGGGIYVSGWLKLFNGAMVCGNKVVLPSTAINGAGGGIYLAAASSGLLMENSTVCNNSVSATAGASQGGGIYTTTDFAGGIDIIGSTLSNNSVLGASTRQGGGLFFQGTGTSTGSAYLSITDSRLELNQADQGGAIYARASISMHASVVEANSADTQGGGLYLDLAYASVGTATFRGNSAAGLGGGAVYMQDSSLILDNSTLAGNRAESATAIVGMGGGAIYNAGNTGFVEATQTTFSGNTTTGDGGAIYNAGSTNLHNSTVYGNQAANGGGVYSTGRLHAWHSIIAGNDKSGNGDISGTLTSAGYNLIGNISGSTVTSNTGDQLGLPSAPIDPLLGPLQNNGGLTDTHALLSGSPAIDAGDPAFSSTSTPYDQRGSGFPRVLNNRVDIGAYEYAPNTAPVLHASAIQAMPAIYEDDFTNPGITVAALIAPDVATGIDPVTDADAGAQEGIAVIGANNTNGSWEYSLDYGTTWQAFGSPSATQSRLLAADDATFVHFVPAQDYNGAVSSGLRFRAWDRTDGLSNGGQADTTANGGTTAYSAEIGSTRIEVLPVNDAPSFDNRGNQSHPAGTSGAQSVPGWAHTFVFGPTIDEASQQVQAFLSKTISDPAVISVLSVANDGTLNYVLTGNPGTATFEVTLQDNGGTDNGGIDLSSPAILQINVAAPTDHILDVGLSGTGSGSVTSSPSGINCGTTCSASYPSNSTVALTATPAGGSVFIQWQGDCAGTSASVSVLMDTAKTCEAVFNLAGTSSLGVSQGATPVPSGTRVDFGAVAGPVQKTFTVRNNGTGNLALTGPVVINSGSGFSVASYSAPVILAPGDSTQFSVTLDADSPGAYQASLSVPSDAETFVFGVSGTVSSSAAYPVLQLSQSARPLVSGDTLDFGTTPVSVPVALTLAVSNTGNAALNLSGAGVSPGFSLTGFPSEVAPGASAGFTVRLLAYSAGQQTGYLSFQSNDPDNPSMQIQLSGLVSAHPEPSSPQDLLLSHNRLAEGLPAGSAIGEFSAVSSESGEVYSYAFTSGAGDTDNAAFQLNGSQLSSAVVFDYSLRREYSIRVEVFDHDGDSYSKNFTIYIDPVNQAPSDILLNPASVYENQPAGVAVGGLSTVDADLNDQHSYSLVSGEGDSDNGAFFIQDNVLFTAQTFDYEVRALYTLRVRSTDLRSGTTEKTLVVSILPQSVLVQSLYAGWKHACAQRVNGALECWGWNNFGQARPPETLGTIRHLSAGGTHNCAVQDTGRLICWGNNQSGQSSPPAGTDFRQASTGGNHSCALRQDGGILCWGYNHDGQASAPADRPFVQVSTGGFHTCALREDHSVACWGWNNHGQSSPPADARLAQISSGEYHTCGLTEAGAIQCWGKNFHGQASPPTGEGFIQISSGEEHSCALHKDGYALCWGWNPDGRASPPWDNRDFAQVAAGGNYTCAVRQDNSIVCWGVNDQGQATPPAEVPNRRPSEVFLDNTRLAPDQPAGTVIGQLLSVDLDAADTHTYQLVAGEGDRDNGRFVIAQDRLLSTESLPVGEYSLRVQSDDGHNGRLEGVIVVRVE